jgi:predicted nuclease of predicted toxin-antitoxin system
VKFLVDENLSPRVAELLSEKGHNAVHVREIQASGAPDADVMRIAESEGRVIISADTDFGALLAQARAVKPSVVLVREFAALRPPELAALVLGHLKLLQEDLEAGAIAVFTRRGIRVRMLPIA